MQTVSGWFTGASAPDKEPPAASVLDDWKNYSGTSAGSGTSQTDKLLATAEEGASTVSTFISSAFGSAAAAATSAATSVGAGVQSVPGTTQWVYFAALAGSGILFQLLAFFIFLPMIILTPSKFAITFSLGSALIIASMGALKGWKEMVSHMISKERLPFTASYIISLFATLYCSMMMHSYVFSIVSCIAQIITLVYYVASFFPGGTSGAQYVFSTMGKGALSVGGAVVQGVFSK